MILRVEHLPSKTQQKDSVAGWKAIFFLGGGEQDIQNTWDLGATCMQVAPLPLASRVITHNML